MNDDSTCRTANDTNRTPGKSLLREWVATLPDDPDFAWLDDAAVEGLIASMPPDVRAEYEAAGEEFAAGLAEALALPEDPNLPDDLPEEPEWMDTPHGTLAVLHVGPRLKE